MTIDTKRMREFVRRVYGRQLDSTHYEGCEYQHASCAILRLCDELDSLRDELLGCEQYADLIDGPDDLEMERE